MIDQYGRIKLADFGLSSKYEEGQNSSEYSGSKPYMAPELFLRTEHDPFLADIWSLGVTFYQMVSGELPWSTGSPKEMEMAISMGMVSFTSLNLPCELVTMIRGMIEVNVDRRITLDEIIKGPFFTCFILNKSTQNTFSVPGENDSNEIENNNAKSPIPISKSLNITRACSNKIKHQFVDTLHKTGECNGSLNNDDKNKQHVSSIINNAFKGAHPLLQPYSSFTGCNSFHTSSNSFSNQIAPNQPLLKKGLKSGSIGPIKKGEVGKIGAKAGILAIPDCAPKKVLPGNRSVLAFQAIPLIQSGLRMNSSKAHLPVSLKAFLES
ncbi:hypothetical protein TRFO_33340 [Tritrichomonas foetus]|uniref:Protein kinase domain-containing protein n=1 Tax=Tritrichomonas foetus TaxID=1144522 RepID=A0A1J4JLQ7_9EUKA|nr:hypothetical protein TRFO_33340 [Tritrichomonas foetus]|eukprot:OHT00049.1 hypothetical protein TRFO_33340 [Tritrichomonas foetus]